MNEEVKEAGIAEPETISEVVPSGESVPVGVAEAHIGAVTKINVNAMSALTRQVFLSNRVLYVLFGIMMAVFAGLGAVIWAFTKDAALGVGIIAAGILIPPALVVVNLFVIKGLAPKTFQVVHNTVQQFGFGDQISVFETSDVSNGKASVYEWAAIVKAVEKEAYFFMFLNAESAFIIEKAGIMRGSTGEFRALLRARLGDRLK